MQAVCDVYCLLLATIATLSQGKAPIKRHSFDRTEGGFRQPGHGVFGGGERDWSAS